MDIRRFSHLPMKHKIILFTTLILIVTLSLVASVAYYSQKNRILATSTKQMELHLQDMANLLDLQIREKQEQVNMALSVARDQYQSYGQLQHDSSSMMITAINQSTKEQKQLTLQPWVMGETPIYHDYTIVDKIQALTGQTATIFQKIDDGYLRVSTNVKKLDGSRAVDTYIPNNSEVIQTIERGETFKGRAFVVNDWYLTAYEPIRMDGEIVGILYVGVKEKDLNFLKEKFHAKTYLGSGYPYAITQEGTLLIHPYAEGDTVKNLAWYQTMNQQIEGVLTNHWGGTDEQAMIHFFTTYDFFRMKLGIAVPKSELIDIPLASLRYTIFGGVAVILLSLFTLINWFVGKQIAPLSMINEQVRRVAQRKKVTPLKLEREDEIGTINHSLNQLIDGMQGITNFAEAIGEQKFDVDFEALGEEDSLGQALISMRESLHQSAKETQKRAWANQGYNQLSTLIRGNQHSIQKLCTSVLPMLIKYVDACQGAIFIYKEENGQGFLELEAAYAWGRQKHTSRRLPIDSEMSYELIDQVYLEKAPIVLSEVPDSYVEITSGLGKANPNHIIILPLIQNEIVFGVLEMASFKPMDTETQAFLQRGGEDIAASISSLQTTQATQQLLEETQSKTNELTSMEEEVRQNLEEMQATNEEMQRKEREYLARITELEAAQEGTASSQ